MAPMCPTLRSRRRPQGVYLKWALNPPKARRRGDARSLGLTGNDAKSPVGPAYGDAEVLDVGQEVGVVRKDGVVFGYRREETNAAEPLLPLQFPVPIQEALVSRARRGVQQGRARVAAELIVAFGLEHDGPCFRQQSPTGEQHVQRHAWLLIKVGALVWLRTAGGCMCELRDYVGNFSSVFIAGLAAEVIIWVAFMIQSKTEVVGFPGVRASRRSGGQGEGRESIPIDLEP
ncbi:uncharacterized protein PpBr36_06632 [Pyricularia pennisetigena]|uniref:uncharacterized protein n=1 Tax=Pyricularia pennisetigena TaxID=1578925 RepID=UPI001150204F|nr:uncharacterized protein PpBr36_06632 [Pyricularia pennisetigena]TLS22749.1 hypothetical protein PpBr36_06632 [Pyricularia pennisetigena]